MRSVARTRSERIWNFSSVIFTTKCNDLKTGELFVSYQIDDFLRGIDKYRIEVSKLFIT